jgi:lysozyme
MKLRKLDYHGGIILRMTKFNPDVCVPMIKRNEGFRSHPYRCPSNALTIGYGRNLDAKGISEPEATHLLMNDLAEALQQTLDKIPCAKNLSENRRAVLVMMVFNMGVHGVLKFKKMLSALEKGDYLEAAEQMLSSKWASQVKHRANELAEIMITDKF